MSTIAAIAVVFMLAAVFDAPLWLPIAVVVVV
jgi:hypothetical protein